MYESDPLYDEVRNRRAAPARLRARCPECAAWVNLKDSVELWDMVTCRSCGITLEVVDLNPPQVDYISEVSWDEDDWEEEDWN